MEHEKTPEFRYFEKIHITEKMSDGLLRFACDDVSILRRWKLIGATLRQMKQ